MKRRAFRYDEKVSIAFGLNTKQHPTKLKKGVFYTNKKT